MLDRSLVHSVIGSGYDLALDDELFSDSFREPIRRRGCMTKREIVRIGRWKAVRATGHMQFDDDRARLVTRTAFRVQDAGLANWVLRNLSGVGTPMASALLTVFDETTFTVIDARAIATLRELEFDVLELERPSWLDRNDVTGNSWTYGEYVKLCNDIAATLDVSLRDLDRALWAMNGELAQV